MSRQLDGDETTMNCDEARAEFAELVGGGLGLTLTEWATVEAHVGQCAECAQVLDQLYESAPEGHRRRPATTQRASARPSHRRPAHGLTRHATATAVLVLVMGLGVLAVQQRYEVWLSGLRSVLLSLSELGSSGTDNRAQATPQEPIAPSSPTSPIVPELPDAAPPRPAVPASRAKPEPAPESTSPARASGTTKMAPAKRAVPVPAAKPEPAAKSASPTVAPSTDVAIQLSVQDQREAEQHVKTLIARLGGTRRSGERAATMVLVVPRAHYGELTRGLAQIGAWQMESDAGPLPDPVHVAVRLAK